MKTWFKLNFFPKKIIPAVLLIVIVFFGLVVVIYEENSRYKDKLVSYLPVEEVALYLHSDKQNNTIALWRTLPSELTDFWQKQYPEIITEMESINNLALSEYAFVLIGQKNNLNPIWLLYWPTKNSTQFVSNQEFYRLGDVIILGKNAKNLAIRLINKENQQVSLFNYLQNKDALTEQAFYAFINFDVLSGQQNDILVQGRWQLQIKPEQIEILSLEDINQNQFVIHNTDWLQIFYNESLVWQKLSASDIQTVIAQNWLPTNVRDQFNKFSSMTNFDTNNFISKIIGQSDLVVNNSAEDSIYWLVRTKWSDDLLTELNTNVKQLLGFEKPQLATSTLLDGTFAREYKAIPVDFVYQNIKQIDQNVQIVYVKYQDYFLWIRQGDYLIFGNSLKLLNRYLSKSIPENINKQNCLLPGGKGILIGSNEVNSLNKPMIIREIWTKRQLKYLLCF